MERGIYFYENGNFHEAATQFNKVILSYSSDFNSLKSKDLEILAQAYYQLALTQSKLAHDSENFQDKKIHYGNSLKNIIQAEKLAIKPNKLKEYRETRLLIKQKSQTYLEE
tara:strand:- start:1346 stop:1678 length:333 start_codon:yes stop_codon:yes gene_type:complete